MMTNMLTSQSGRVVKEEATKEIRFLKTFHSRILQQLWVISEYSPYGYVDNQRQEWRDVPVVEVEEDIDDYDK